MLPRDHEKHFTTATTNTITADDYDRFMQGKTNYSMEELKRSPLNIIARSKYLFDRKLINFDPMARKTGIRLLKGTIAPFARNYKPMGAQELEAVKKYLDEQLAKGFIRPICRCVTYPPSKEARREHPSLC